MSLPRGSFECLLVWLERRRLAKICQFWAVFYVVKKRQFWVVISVVKKRHFLVVISVVK